jgi:predicted dinucleotide-binding enzyme
MHNNGCEKMKIGIIGSGSMGQALGQCFAKAGHSVLFGTRTSQRVAKWIASEGIKASYGSYADAAQFGDIILLVTGWTNTQAAIESAGSLQGKILIDCTNPNGADGFHHIGAGRAASGAENVAEWALGARVGKAFNHIYGSMLLAGTQFDGNQPTVFYCSDDDETKKVIAYLAKEIGLDPIDVGGLKSARYLEPLGGLAAHLGEDMKWGGENIGLKFLHR